MINELQLHNLAARGLLSQLSTEQQGEVKSLMQEIKMLMSQHKKEIGLLAMTILGTELAMED